MKSTASGGICYGVDASADGIRVVLGRRRGRRVVFNRLDYSRELPLSAGIKGVTVAAALPVAQGIATRVQAPFKSKSKATRVFPTLLDIQLPFPLEECVYSFDDIRVEEGGVTALALAARKQDIEQRLAALGESKIDPHIMDYEGVALWTELLREHEVKEGDDKIRVLLFLRPTEGVLVIGRGRQFAACHKINVSSPQSIDRYLRAQFNRLNAKPENESVEWFWAGSGYEPGELGAQLQDHIGEVWQGGRSLISEPEYFLARALAARALLTGDLRVNLRAGEFMHPELDRRMRVSTRNTALTVLLAGLVLGGGALASGYWLDLRIATAEQAVQTKVQGLLGYKLKARGPQALIIVQRDLESRRKADAPLLDMLKPSLLKDLQKIIAVAASAKLHIAEIELTHDGFVLRATAPSREVAGNFAATVRGMGYSVKLSDGQVGSKGYDFRLKGGPDAAR